eukprot:1030245-Rhodomonas_salina.3
MAVHPLTSTEYPKKSPAAGSSVWLTQAGASVHDDALRTAINGQELPNCWSPGRTRPNAMSDPRKTQQACR